VKSSQRPGRHVALPDALRVKYPVRSRHQAHPPPSLPPQLRAHLLEDGYDIRTIQSSSAQHVSTTLLDTQVLNRGPHGVPSPLDER
jgi:hypothetical protein